MERRSNFEMFSFSGNVKGTAAVRVGRVNLHMIKLSECPHSSFFTVCTKLAEMAILYSKELTTAKKSYLQRGLT